MTVELFKWLMNYHCTVNLEHCLPHIIDGKVHNEKPLREGIDENKLYNGLLIIANGSTLVDKLVKSRIILDEEPVNFVSTLTEEHFFEYLLGQENSDGAYIFDRKNMRIAHVHELNNNPHLPKKLSISNTIPSDFVSYNGNREVDKIGTRTRIAMRLPKAYENTEGFQIKQTAYTSLGIGKVTHFNEQGLIEEFFFMYDPINKGPFINEERGIIGIYRSYKRDGNNLVRISEEPINRHELGVICY